MPKVFISYRREDSAASTGRLSECLGAHFGAGNIFRDLDDIIPGEQFAAVIDSHIVRCDALVAVIGRQWVVATTPTGRRRLDEAGDFVKLEIATALRLGKLVIPAMIDGAKVPAHSELPPDIAPLVQRNAAEISESRFAFDVQRLIDSIEALCCRGALSRAGRLWRRARAALRRHAVAAAVSGGLVLAGAGWVVNELTSPDIPVTSEQALKSLDQRHQEILAQLARTAPQEWALRDALGRELAELQRKRADAPAAAAERSAALGQLDRALRALGSGVPAAAQQQAQLALRANDTAPARALLAQVADQPGPAADAAHAAYALGELARTEVNYRSALDRFAQAARLLPQDPAYLSAAGLAALQMGQLAKAQPYLEAAVQASRQAPAIDDVALAQSINNLALQRKHQGRLDDARSLYEEALLLQMQGGKPDERLVATIEGNLALVLKRSGPDSPEMRARIESLLREALESTRRLDGPAHPDTATALNNLGVYLFETGRDDEAAVFLQDALTLRRNALPPQHPDVAQSLVNLGALYFRQGALDKAVDHYSRAAAAQREHLGSDHPDLAVTLNNLAQAHHQAGRVDAAVPLYREALEIFGQASGSDERRVAVVAHRLALAHLYLKQPDQAEPLLRRAIGVHEARGSPQGEAWAGLVEDYAQCLTQLGRPAEAARWRARK